MKNFVRNLRKKAGLSQERFAKRVQTSQSAIAAYEGGAKSPTFSTLERFVDTLGFDMHVSFVASLTREDKRSLFYHKSIVKNLLKNPSQILKKANKNLNHMRQKHPHAKRLFDEWKNWFRLPIDELIHRMLDPNVYARDMRQVSPFSGILSAKERMQILKEFKKENQL